MTSLVVIVCFGLLLLTASRWIIDPFNILSVRSNSPLLLHDVKMLNISSTQPFTMALQQPKSFQSNTTRGTHQQQQVLSFDSTSLRDGLDHHHHRYEHDSPTKPQNNYLGTVILLAPQRNANSIWDIDRFCLLLRSVRSVDQHLNRRFGPYPIHIILAKDYALDPQGKDGAYTADDRALIRKWAPMSTIIFVEINMYSQDALEPNMTMEQAKEWKNAMAFDFPHGIGYASMCRLWSGRLQQMDFLRQQQHYQYYMRMDDDSLLVEDVPFDPFVKMMEEKLLYAYRRDDFDEWGVSRLWQTTKSFINVTDTTPFVNVSRGEWNNGVYSNIEYEGEQPYNNFHVTAVSFWTTPQWMTLWEIMNDDHLFFQHRVGDANVHAIACMLMKPEQRQVWGSFPYRHNSNDMEDNWPADEWTKECQAAYAQKLSS
jgi:hypothetical protein